jgi:hypothetical protein
MSFAEEVVFAVVAFGHTTIAQHTADQYLKNAVVKIRQGKVLVEFAAIAKPSGLFARPRTTLSRNNYADSVPHLGNGRCSMARQAIN